MDALLTRWTASNQDPRHLFPGTHADILLLLQEWVTRRKQNNVQLMALQNKLHACNSALFVSEPSTPHLSVDQKRKLASETLELFSQANALRSTYQHETLQAIYLLATLASRGLRQPNYDPRVRVDDAVCSYLAQILPAFDRAKELSLLVDVAEEARREAKQVEMATAIRERTGVDVFVDTESRAMEVEKLLRHFVQNGHFGERVV